MGEMCDFEAEYYPQNWGPSYRKSGKTRTKKVITIRMNQQEHAAYKNRPPYEGNETTRYSQHTEGESDGADLCADKIRARGTT